MRRNSWHGTAMDRDLPTSFKIATVWLLAGACLFLAVQWWQQRAQAMRFQADGGTIELRRGADGHYHWPGRINGRSVEFLVDTGATGTAISTALARDLGLDIEGNVTSQTANGTVVGARVRADLVLQGGVRVQRLPITALPALDDRPLLGMDVLGRLHWQQRDGVLRIDRGAAAS